MHRKKRFTSFPSPAGMSLTKLPLGRNNSVMTSLFPPRESLVVTSRLGTGNSRTFFFTVWSFKKVSKGLAYYYCLRCFPDALMMLIFNAHHEVPYINVCTVRKRKDYIIIFLEITQFLSRRETGRIKISMTRKNSQTGVQQDQNRHSEICLHFTKLLREERTRGFFHGAAT
jgi:hypothetical protein